MVTEWPGSGESMASNEVCAIIRKDVPVITRASVDATDESNGAVELRWSAPTDADTVVFPGPYRYQVWGGAEGDSDLNLLHETAPGAFLNAPDTAWVLKASIPRPQLGVPGGMRERYGRNGHVCSG